MNTSLNKVHLTNELSLKGFSGKAREINSDSLLGIFFNYLITAFYRYVNKYLGSLGQVFTGL